MFNTNLDALRGLDTFRKILQAYPSFFVTMDESFLSRVKTSSLTEKDYKILETVQQHSEVVRSELLKKAIHRHFTNGFSIQDAKHQAKMEFAMIYISAVEFLLHGDNP